MKKQIFVIMLLVFATILCRQVVAANNPGPAPNSGDGISDGSGFEPTISTVGLLIILVIPLVGLLLLFFLFKRRKMRALSRLNSQSNYFICYRFHSFQN
jgi:hypothetical protein